MARKNKHNIRIQKRTSMSLAFEQARNPENHKKFKKNKEHVSNNYNEFRERIEKLR